MGRLKGPLWSVGIGAALYAYFAGAFANWDTMYTLVWGSEVTHGRRPEFDGVALAPTNHPLYDLLGLVLSGFGDTAETLVVALGFLALGALTYLVYRLATELFGPLAGVVAALALLSREPVLSFGARAYVDIPYTALVIGALVIEVRRPRAGASVLSLLFLAGLLRPEAWLFSAAYVVWLALPERGRGEVGELEVLDTSGEDEVPRDPTPEEAESYWAERRRRSAARKRDPSENRRRAIRLIPLVLAAPLLWALIDLASTGDALASLSGTQDNVDTLGRSTGLDGFVSDGPRKLGEILREPGLVGAVIGAGLGLVWLRTRTVMVLVWIAIAVFAFAVLAAFGLPVITRYLILTAALLCLLVGEAVGGWTLMEKGNAKGVWLAGGMVTVALLLLFAPSQASRIGDLHDSIRDQARITDDLHDLADEDAFPKDCSPVVVPNSRPIPNLALWLDRMPSDFVTPGDARQARRGIVLLPANARVAKQFVLDKNDPGASDIRRPANFQRQAANRSWRVYANCKQPRP
jgi:hypothetical protein